MLIRKVTVGLGITVQPRSYEAFRVDVTLEAEVEPGENYDDTVKALRERASEDLHEGIQEEIEKLYGHKVVERVLKDAT